MYIIKLISIITIIYSTLSSTIERNKYPFNVKQSHIKNISNLDNLKKIETTKKTIFRKKIWFDIKFHNERKISTEKSTVEILVNNEGKIIGYKPCKIFYPNYFTKNQQKELIKIGKKFKLKKINPCLIKYKNVNARIDL